VCGMPHFKGVSSFSDTPSVVINNCSKLPGMLVYKILFYWSIVVHDVGERT